MWQGGDAVHRGRPLYHTKLIRPSRVSHRQKQSERLKSIYGGRNPLLSCSPQTPAHQRFRQHLLSLYIHLFIFISLNFSSEGKAYFLNLCIARATSKLFAKRNTVHTHPSLADTAPLCDCLPQHLYSRSEKDTQPPVYAPGLQRERRGCQINSQLQHRVESINYGMVSLLLCSWII